jgi:type VI secretion system protein VasD
MQVETSAVIDFVVSADVNPDDDNRPSPLVIRLIKLADARQFEREDLISLYENPAERLGSDYIDSIRMREFTPGESRSETIELDDSVQYLGLVAEFSQYQDASATLTLPIIANKANRFTVNIQGTSLKRE